MADINFTIDISDAVDKTAKILGLNAAQKKSLLELQATTINLAKATTESGEAYKPVIAYVDQLVNADQRLVAVLKNEAGAWKEQSVSIKASTEAIKRQREQVQALLSQPISGKLNQLFPTNKANFTDDEKNRIERIKTAIRSLDTGVVNPDILGDLFKRIRSGEFVQATGTIAKLRDELVKLRNIENTATARERFTTNRSTQFANLGQQTILPQLSQQFNQNLSELTRQQQRTIGKAFENIDDLLRNNKSLDPAKIQDTFNKLRGGQKIEFFNNDALRQTANELTKVIGIFERLDAQRRRSAQINQNALDQRTQSAAEQVRNQQQVSSVQSGLSRVFDPLNLKLSNIDPSLGLDKNNRIQEITRRIAEMAVKAKLAAGDITVLYSRFNNNTLTAADSQFARITSQFARLNSEIDKQKVKANDYTGTQTFTGVKGELPPSNDATNRAKDYYDTWNKLKTVFTYFVLYRGINFITNQLQEGFEAARKFQVQISLIRTISQENQLSFGAWEQAIRGVSDAIGHDLTDTSKAFYDTASNQIAKGIRTAEFVKSAGDLARTTQSTLQDSVNLLSSALNVYGFDVSQADEVSAKFFKTIDLGRIKANELANTFGRVSFVAKDLGVPFDELLALMSTLTRRGVTTDDALTLITNGMNKLLKPTAETQKLLNAWGYSTGEAAIRSKGFINILGDMVEASQKGQISISELFNEIRGQKFISGIKSALGEVKNDLSEIRDKSLATYDKAKGIRGESDADKVNKAINQFKNAVTTEFGGQLVNIAKNLLDITGGINGVITVMKQLINITIAGTAAWLGYKAGVLATNAVLIAQYVIQSGLLTTSKSVLATTVAQTRATFGLTSATAANTSATAANAAVLRIHPIGAIVGILAAAAAYIGTSTVKLEEYNEKLIGVSELYDKLKDKIKQAQSDSYFKIGDQVKDQAQEQIRKILGISAKSLAEANKELEKATENSKKVGEELGRSVGEYADSYKSRIQEISKELEKLDDRLKRSSRNIIDLKDKTLNAQDALKLKYATDPQALNIYDQQITRLKSRKAELFAVGTDEAVQEARRISEEILRIRQAQFEKQDEISKYYFEKNAQYNQKQGLIPKQMLDERGIPIPDGYRDYQGRLLRPVDTTPFDKATNRDLAETQAQELAYQQRKKREAQDLEAQKIAERDKLRQTELALEELSKFKITDEAGEILPKFKDKLSGRVDISKVKTSFEDIRKRIFESADIELANKLKLGQLLQDKLDSVLDVISKTERVKGLTDQQREIVNLQEKQNTAFVEGRKAINDYNADIKTTTENLSRLAEALKVFGGDDLLFGLRKSQAATDPLAQKLRNQRPGFVNDVTDFLSDNRLARGFGLTTDKLKDTLELPDDKAKQRLTDYRKEIENIQNALKELPSKTVTENGVSKLDPNAVQSLIDRLRQARQTAGGILKDSLGTDQVTNARIKDSLSIPQIDELLDKLQGEFNKSTTKYNSSIDQFEKLKQQTKDIGDLAGSTAKNINDIGPAAAAAGTAAITGLGPLSDQLDTLIRKAQLLNQSLEFKKAFDKFTPQPDIESKAYGGPIGQDTLFRHSSGEFVMNESATNQFYSQIQGMNSIGRTPRSFGNHVEMGGVTFNINGAQSPEATAQSSLSLMRRAARRGLV